MLKRFLLVANPVVTALIVAAPAHAQNTAGVPPPGFPDGHESLQYRVAYETDSDAFAQRVHYQQSFDEKRLWRVIVQGRKTGDRDNDFDFAQGEIFWRLTGPTRRWQHGLRFDLRVRHEGRPATVGLNWSNEFSFADDWRFRTVVLTAIDVGDGARDGVFLQTRNQLNYSLAPRQNLGFELFSVYGSSKDIPSLKDQNHQLGPYVVWPIGDKWQLFGSALAGLTDNSQDLNLKLWFTRAL